MPMDMRFKDIKVCIWDFDGTLYKPNPDLWIKIREAEYQVIMDHTHWDKNRTIFEFDKTYKKVLQSATETVARLCGITTEAAALEMEKHYDRRVYLVGDELLIKLFQSLKNFRHLILANGVSSKIEEALVILGVPRETFEIIITSELTGVNKPSEIPFQYVLHTTNLPAANHLMIGDRELVDLTPAKKMGMKTCLVWSEEPSKIADVTLKTVYEVEKLLL